MITDKGNDQESRDGYSSSDNNNGGEPLRKKRTRVGDLRKQAYNAPDGDQPRERRPYRPEGGDRNDGDRRPYNSDNRGGGYSGNRGGYSNDRGGYSNNREGGYSNNRGGGYSNNRGGGYSNNRSGGYSDNRGGGYSDNRGGGYSSNRGGGSNYGRSNYGGGGDRRPQRPMGTGRPMDGPKRLVKPVKYKENIDPSTPLRLNKYLANAGVCSRREADAYITSGVVKVNGVVVDQLGAKVTRGDLVTFQDKPVQLESKLYVLLNKPKNCVTTSDDPQNRLTVMDLVKNACPERIYPVGRLDRNTTGVLLLTNDGDLASKLMHPKFKKKKIYQVTLDRDVTIEDMQSIADGIELDDGEIHADSIAYQSEDMLNVVGIEIHSGRNRIVRRIFEKLGYQVMKLDRVYFAGLTKKNIPRGKWRYLTEKEVNMLRMGAFE
ncbi:pseudouridine synthase [Dysgonomonas sp. 511]|uniref:pseudouridine synthase n=1 Tax=Dysgonomonas sp. 511 TaxID=2302930 RepID=UPI0013D69492|nr:pseudouridine synthase [Dysgonomonas sp. 511]NDV77697.1 pseudouridine synthase [Dysgonomonas sp. 511]